MTIKDFILGEVLPRILPAKTLDRAVSVFVKAVAELEAVEAAAQKRIAASKGKIDNLNTRIDGLQTEIRGARETEMKAADLADKLRTLIA